MSSDNEKDNGEKEKPKTSKGASIAKGDIITVEYDAWIINPDGAEELFDTTNEEHAKAGEIYDEKTTYAPVNTVAGEGRVIAGLDNSFLTAKVGEKSAVKIPPEEGAGERQPNLMEIHSIRELQKQKIDPEIGMRVQIKNKMGTIVAVTSGRVRIDFNDPLAGKTLKYEFKVLKKADTPEEKILGLIEADYGKSEGFEVHVDGEILEIYLPDLCKYDQVWFTLKYKLVSDLRELLGYKTIRFVEEYVKKEEEASDTPEEEPAETEVNEETAGESGESEEPAETEVNEETAGEPGESEEPAETETGEETAEEPRESKEPAEPIEDKTAD